MALIAKGRYLLQYDFLIITGRYKVINIHDKDRLYWGIDITYLSSL